MAELISQEKAQNEEDRKLLELFCADPQVDNPLPDDIHNYGANTDESNYVEDYMTQA